MLHKIPVFVHPAKVLCRLACHGVVGKRAAAAVAMSQKRLGDKFIILCVQPYPDVGKQPEWELDVKPDAVDWDAEIAAVVERGKDVPEVDWVKPGEDAAMEVISSPIMAQSCGPFSLLTFHASLGAPLYSISAHRRDRCRALGECNCSCPLSQLFAMLAVGASWGEGVLVKGAAVHLQHQAQ